MTDITGLKKRLYQVLKEKAYHEGRIRLASGKMSHYYFDARAVTLSSEGAYLVAAIVFDLVKDLGVTAVGGPTLGADPIVGALALLSYQHQRPINTFLLRKKPKVHGRQLMIEGPVLAGEGEVVLIDDVATTGGSLLSAIDVLEKMERRVRRAIVILDRQEGAQEALARRGCDLTSIFTARDFLSS